ncbi:unnamed protein product [Meloidogyne enterolobii]|uniref:Uncharacterized protein n=1 Tax=Meloidogyne enterolobii TaxID=390850 RepID=A0ACB1AZQ9_MELEN
MESFSSISFLSKTLKQINQMLQIKTRNPFKYGYGDEQQPSSQNPLKYGYPTGQQSSHYFLRSQQNPSSVLCVRIGDVDHSFHALNQNWDIMSKKSGILNWAIMSSQTSIPTTSPMLEEILQSIQRGEMPKFNRLISKFGLQQLQSVQNHTYSAIFNEREALIPTSVGLPIKIVNSVPMLMNVEASTQLQDKQNQQAKIQIDARIMAGVSHVQRIGSWTPFLITGVSNTRSVEVNLPIQAELNTNTYNSRQSLTVKVKMPKETTRLFGAHSHQYTYRAEIDLNTNSPMGREYRTIRNPKLDRLQYQFDKVIGSKNVGIPVHVYAHYHWPSNAANIVQILKMLTSTENAMHVTYQPGQETAREVVFNMNTENFQPVKAFQSKMNNFFERSATSNEEGNPQEGIMPEDQQQYYANQQQKLQTFLSNYQKSQKHQKHYKHSMELSAKTMGGSKQFKASVQLQAQCNDKMQVCQLRLGAERSKMNEERGMWTMKGQVEMVMPGGAEEENSNSYASDQFLSFANLHWGADTRKQQVNMRIVGEQAPERTSG